MTKKVFLKSGLSFILAVMPILICFSLSNIEASADDTSDGYTVPSAEENIEIHLFNYGSKVNDANNDFTFILKAKDYQNIAIDAPNEFPSWCNNFTVNSELENGYPVITHKDPSKKEDNLQYLFDTSIDFDNGGGTAQEYDPITNSDYFIKHFAVSNDGTGTGLFQYDDDGYLYYNSTKNAASFDTSTNKFVLYNYIATPTGTTNHGQFFPFNTFHKYGTLANSTYNGLEEYYLKFENDNRNTYYDTAFGMSMEFNFYVKEDSTFEFTGDDDCLVYIDNKLVLDISGDHGILPGSIDFTTGKVNYKNTTANTTASSIDYTGAEFNTTLDEIFGTPFDKDALHNMKIFYLERGGMESNLSIKFNLNIADSVPISKQLLGADESDTETFNFTAYKLDDSAQRWIEVKNAALTTKGSSPTNANLTLPLDFSTNNTNTFLITENVPKDEDKDKLITYDTGFYIVTATKDEETGKVKYSINEKDYGKDSPDTPSVNVCEFINYKMPKLTVTKTVEQTEAVSSTLKFPFTLTVYDTNGNSYAGGTLYKSDETYITLDANGTCSFDLGNGDDFSAYLPYGFTYTVTEGYYSGYIPYISLNESEEKTKSYSYSDTDGITQTTVVGFTNKRLKLPLTGGMGVYIFMIFGILAITVSSAYLIAIHRKKVKIK